MILQLLDGRTICPLNVFDVLETVEEYLGVDVRQYLEGYLTDENPWNALPDDEKTAGIIEHYKDVLDSINTEVQDCDRMMHKNPIKRKQIIENLENIIRTIEGENHGKESI